MPPTRRPQHLALPPASVAGWKQLNEARAEYDRLTAQWRAAGQRLEQLEGERVKAEHLDRRRASGMARKKPEAPHPGWPERDAVDRQLAEARDRREALAGALVDAEADLEQLLADNGEAWQADAEAAAEQARQELAAAVESWAEARSAFRERQALVHWLRTGPRRSWRATPTGGHLEALRGPNGQPVVAQVVVEALRADAAGLPVAAPSRGVAVALVHPGPEAA